MVRQGERAADGAGARLAVPPEDIDRELDALPAAQRQAVLLRYLEGLPQEEAARVAGCPQGTLARRAQLGLERLRERLCQRGRVLSAAALVGLLGAEAAAAAPASLLPSILAVPKLAAVGAAAGAAGGIGTGASVLADGVLKMMFWAKVKVAAVVAAAILAVGGGGGAAAAKLLAGETAGEKASPPRPGETPKAQPSEKPAEEAAPKAVNGLKLTISADKLEAKAGDEVKIAANLENVSKEALRVFKHYSEISWELVAPDGESLQYVPHRGPVPGIAPPSDLSAFPEIAAGGKLDYPATGISGNPPVIGVGGEPRFNKVCLLKPGVYKLTAVYTNQLDKLWTKDFKGQQPVPGKVWKGTVRSNTLELKLGGDFKAPAEAAPWPAGGIPGVTPPQKGQKGAEAVKPKADEDRDGLRFTLTADKQTIRPGDTATLTATFENVSKEDLSICLDGGRRDYPVDLRVVGPDQDAVRQAVYSGPPPFPGPRYPMIEEFKKLPPNGKQTSTFVFRGDPPAWEPVRKHVFLTKPGTYRIEAVYTNSNDQYTKTRDSRKDEPVPVPGKVWKGTVSAALELKVEGSPAEPALRSMYRWLPAPGK